MSLDAAGIIEDLSDLGVDAEGVYMVTRYAPSAYSSGVLVPDSVGLQRTITATVAPANGRDLQRLPEGFWTKEVIAVIAADELQAPEDAAGATGGDVITIGAKRYQVEHVENWGSFWRALAVKL